MIYIDIWIPLALLAVEIDGSHHLWDENRKADMRRTRELEKIGIEVVRFTNADVLEKFPNVVRKIMQICAERGYAPEASFTPSIVACSDPAPHYLLTLKNPDGSIWHEKIELHSQRARNLGLEYLNGKSTLL